MLYFLASHDGKIHFLTLSRHTAVLCNQLRRLYDWKYALIAPRVYFGPRYLAKNNTSQNKAGVMWTRSNLRCLWRGFCLPLKCTVPKLQCCHNEVLPCNYPAVRYTQQPSRESAENSVCVLQCHAVNRTAWLYSGRPSPEVAGPDELWSASSFINTATTVQNTQLIGTSRRVNSQCIFN